MVKTKSQQKKTVAKATFDESLKANLRKLFGRKVKRLRKEGVLPASLYGKKVKSVSLEVKEEDFSKVYKKMGETGLVELLVGSSKKPVLIHNVQKDPVSDKIIHVDFLQVDLKQKVTTTVPIEFSGESPAEKSGIGTVVQETDEVEVEALPTDLPEKFVVDLSSLQEVDQIIKVGDLEYNKAKVEIKTPLDRTIAKVEPPQKEEVVVPTPVAEEGEKVPSAEEAEQKAEEESKEQTPEEKEGVSSS